MNSWYATQGPLPFPLLSTWMSIGHRMCYRCRHFLPAPFCSMSTGRFSTSRRRRWRSWCRRASTVALERAGEAEPAARSPSSAVAPLAELDLFFAPLKLPAIAGHGAELRLADGRCARATTLLDPQLRPTLVELERRHERRHGRGQGLFDRAPLPAGAASRPRGARRGERDLCATFPSTATRDPARQVRGRGEAAVVQQGHRRCAN